tara:strand:- start:217 stop:507 length:291 start_codon:yes stop_codon:yes gene_type:complete
VVGNDLLPDSSFSESTQTSASKREGILNIPSMGKEHRYFNAILAVEEFDHFVDLGWRKEQSFSLDERLFRPPWTSLCYFFLLKSKKKQYIYISVYL